MPVPTVCVRVYASLMSVFHSNFHCRTSRNVAARVQGAGEMSPLTNGHHFYNCHRYMEDAQPGLIWSYNIVI